MSNTYIPGGRDLGKRAFAMLAGEDNPAFEPLRFPAGNGATGETWGYRAEPFGVFPHENHFVIRHLATGLTVSSALGWYDTLADALQACQIMSNVADWQNLTNLGDNEFLKVLCSASHAALKLTFPNLENLPLPGGGPNAEVRE